MSVSPLQEVPSMLSVQQGMHLRQQACGLNSRFLHWLRNMTEVKATRA